MGQPAYDMSSEVRRRKAPQTQRKVALRVEKGGKRRLSPFQAAMQHALQLISMALLAVFAVSLLWSEAQRPNPEGQSGTRERAEPVHLL